MSELLKEYDDTRITDASIMLVEKVFGIKKKPIEVIISEYVIFLKYGDDSKEGMIPHDDFEIFYSLDENDEIVLINILEPTLILDFIDNRILQSA